MEEGDWVGEGVKDVWSGGFGFYDDGRKSWEGRGGWMGGGARGWDSLEEELPGGREGEAESEWQVSCGEISAVILRPRSWPVV